MAIWLILAVTVFYALYNIMFKLSGAAIPASATSTIFGTIVLQIAALSGSLVFLSYQLIQGGHTFKLSPTAYFWAAIAGLCISAAEIIYLYIFGGLNNTQPVEASTAIPVIVGGTIILASVFAVFVIGERMSLINILGVGLVIAGLVLVVHQRV